jgi:hypothetical protein
MTLFAKARAGIALTPAQRATLRLVEGLLATAGLTAVYAFAQYMLGRDLASINYADLGRFALGAFLVTLVLTGVKYVKAHGDPAIGVAAGTIARRATHAARDWADIPNDIVIEPDV